MVGNFNVPAFPSNDWFGSWAALRPLSNDCNGLGADNSSKEAPGRFCSLARISRMRGRYELPWGASRRGFSPVLRAGVLESSQFIFDQGMGLSRQLGSGT